VLFELGLVRVMSIDTVVTIAPMMSLVGTLGLIVLTRPWMRAARERLERVEQLKLPL
jgi:hypothetical protein